MGILLVQWVPLDCLVSMEVTGGGGNQVLLTDEPFSHLLPPFPSYSHPTEQASERPGNQTAMCGLRYVLS